MSPKIKLGFIGCGIMGQCVHLPSFSKVKDAEIVAISDLQPKLVKFLADKWNIKKVYPSHLELIEDKEIDAIIIITNKFVHAPIAIDAFKVGKHVFTEKPIATTSKDALEMVNAAEKHDLKLMVGYMKRFDSGVLEAKEAFKSFENDEVTFARIHNFFGDWRCGFGEEMVTTNEKYPLIEPRYPEFVSEEVFRKVMDKFLEQIHEINLPRYFLGDPLAVESLKIWPGDFLDSSYTPGGFVGSILNYGDYPLSLEFGSMSADFFLANFLIYFKHGWIDLKLPSPMKKNEPAKVHVYRAGSIQRDEYPHACWSWAFEREAEHFVECIVKDKEPISGGADSYKDIVIIESMIKSAIENKRIEIKY